MPWMYAINDDGTVISNKGDSGSMSIGYWVEGDETKSENNAKPRVGIHLKVGSPYARSFSQQDWWMTSLITEIIDEYVENGIEHIKFRTFSGSTYLWKS